MSIERDWTRRDVLKTAAAGGIVSALHQQTAVAQEAAPADPDRIRRENEQPGTRDWMTTNVRIDPDDQVPQPVDRRLRLEDERPAR